MDIYAQNILDRYKEPFYKDNEFQADMEHEEANHSCGDKINVKLKTKNEKIDSYSFSGAGCAISQASADMLGDVIDGLSADEVLELSKKDICEVLGIEISMRRAKCALLGLLALQNAILKDREETPRSWTFYHV
jgi:nitrogen fixation NifU-like protein